MVVLIERLGGRLPTNMCMLPLLFSCPNHPALMDPPTNTNTGSQHPPPIQTTDPVSRAVTEQRLEALREEKGAAVKAVASGSQGPGGSTAATNPAPSSEIARRWQEVRQKGKDADLVILSQGPHGSTEATNPAPSSEVARRWQEVRRKGKDAEPKIPSWGSHGSTEATNPAPSSEMARRWPEVRQKGKDVEPKIPSEDHEPACADTFPITQLATDHLTCRILMVEEQGTLQVPGAESIHVRRQVDSKGSEKEDKGNDTEENVNKGKGKGKGRQEKGNQKKGNGNEKGEKGNENCEEEYGEKDPSAECLAVTQPQDDICCRVESPVQFELYYDPKGDSVWASGVEPVIRIEPLTSGDEGRQPDKTKTETLQQFDYMRVGPGAWRFSSEDGLRSVRRSYSLANIPSLSSSSRPSRTLRGPSEGPHQRTKPQRTTRARTLASWGPVATSEVIKRLDSPAELAEGQMLQVMDTAGAKEYSIFRMALLGKTGSAQVFQAKHSSFPDRLVAVKTFTYGN